MDSGRADAKTTGINPKTGKKEGGSGKLYRELDNPSYTIMSNPRKLVINLDGAGESNSRRAKSADFDINSTSGTSRNNKPTLREIETKPKKIRSLTIEETLILQGFDPKYDMTQARTQKNRWTMIGNAVVPAVAKAIIGGIKQ